MKASIIKKTGLLLVIILVPVFFYFFLRGFGSNHLKLPVYWPLDSVEVNSGHYEVTKAKTIPPFSFINQDSAQISSKEVEGKIYVADFFFTRCPGICPIMSNELVRVQEAFKNDDSIKILSFSIDPVRDSVAVLKAYADKFGAINGKWHFLTGDRDAIFKLAMEGFMLSASEDKTNPDNFDHSPKLVLVDKQGWVRGFYDATDALEVDRLITEINVLKDIYDKRAKQ